jgi:hypothetical protein
VPLVQGFLFSRPRAPWPELSLSDARGDKAATPPESPGGVEQIGVVEPRGALQPVA